MIAAVKKTSLDPLKKCNKEPTGILNMKLLLFSSLFFFSHGSHEQSYKDRDPT